MNLIHLSRAEYNTLSTQGTLTKGGVTYTFDPINNEYIVPGGGTKYLHNVTLQQSGSNYYEVRASFQIINDSPDAIDTTVKLYNALKAIVPTSNIWYPCNILGTRSTDYSESAVFIYLSDNIFKYGWGPASHQFLDSTGTVYYDGQSSGGGGAPTVKDIVTEI